MLNTLRTLPSTTRTLLMVFLVLGALLRSGLWLLGEVHATEHQLQDAVAQQLQGAGESPAPAEAVEEHAQASHGLLHLTCGASLDACFALELVVPRLPGTAPVPPLSGAFASAPLLNPFRPPIA